MRTASWILLGLLTAVTVYGVVAEKLYLQMWDPAGGWLFLTYLAVFAAVSGVIVWLRPGWLGPVSAAFVLVYTIWWSGPAAPLAVLYFLGSCFLLGRRLSRSADIATAMLLGSAVWMFVIWIALHFPINKNWIYCLALLIPYIAFGKRLTELRFRFDSNRADAVGLAVLLAILLARWLVALKPEVSADGLSMHLLLPMAVARSGSWAFAFQRQAWALMPAGADSLYTGVFLLGGEAAARLLNFSFLAIIVALITLAVRRWVSIAWSWLIAALFVSTPLVALVTGSLFVENVWAAFVLAATLALARYVTANEEGELAVLGILLGAALATKLMAAAFAAPIAVIAGVAMIRNRHWKAAAPAVAVMFLVGASPYLFAYQQSGNPIFPFANTIFKSPYWDAKVPFSDKRFDAKLSLKTPYELTFRSGKFIEGGGGSVGLQYFLFLIPLAVLVRRREQAVLVGVAAAGVGIILLGAPNLRYMYPALPLLSIAIAWFVAQAPPIAAAIGLLLLTSVNLWLTPAAGSYNADFALFRHSDVPIYLNNTAPTRLLTDYLNHAAPGEPVAVFSTEAIADLKATAYADSWHNEAYWSRVRKALTPADIKTIFDELDIHHVIAPTVRTERLLTLRMFLKSWLVLDGPSVGGFSVFRVRRGEEMPLHHTGPFGPGKYDDLENAIDYSGPWYHDQQFPETWGASVTYCDVPGASLRITFTGTAIDYVYTAASNRGVAQVLIDGRQQPRVNLYSKETKWQSVRRFGDLPQGPHTFEVRVTGEKDPRSSGVVVDLDGFTIE